MTDRPIIFSGPMVQALRGGTKTQTRRVLKPQPDFRGNVSWGTILLGQRCVRYQTSIEAGTLRLPYAPGDRLWVREKFSGPYNCAGTPPSRWIPNSYKTPADRAREADGYIWYWADGNPDFGDWTRPKPSIHMPRWASRLTLTVTDVRLQRLQEISEEDAKAEGIEWCSPPPRGLSGWRDYFGKPGDMTRRYFGDARRSFETLWNSIHSPDAWDANPWVCAVTFTLERRNIDQ